MKTSTFVSLSILLLGTISVVSSTATDACDAFWKSVTPLFPGKEEGQEGQKKKVGVKKGPKKVKAEEEPGAKRAFIPILSQAVKWSKPHEMILFVDGGSSMMHGTCPCQKQDKGETTHGGEGSLAVSLKT